MDNSDLAEFTVFSERTPDEFETLLISDKLTKLKTDNDQQLNQVEDQWKYLVFAEKRVDLQDTEHECSESGEELEKSTELIRLGVKISPDMTDKTLNNSKTKGASDSETTEEDELVSDREPKNESNARDEQQGNKIERRRKSVIIGAKKKSSSQGDQGAGELDDSGLGLNDSVEIGTVETLASGSRDNDKSDESKASLNDHTSSNETLAVDQQTETIRRDKKLAVKRKLHSHETKHEESDEPDETTPNKRGRGKYKLRNLAKNNVPKDKETAGRSVDTESDEESNVEDNAENVTLIDKISSVTKRTSALNRKILRMLNEGSPAQLKTLSRIGPKTANMIYQYRRIHGKFASIRDLENMAGLSPRMFELFLAANNINLD